MQSLEPKLLHSAWRMKTYKINGEWIGRTAGGCINHLSWRFNPQVFLRVKERKTIKIKLQQLGDTKPYHIGFYVAKADTSVGVRRQLSLTRDQLTVKAGFEPKKDISAEVTLEAGEEYFMVPCTFAPRDEGKFSCFFSVDGELSIRLLTPESEWSVVEESGEWLGRTAGGCKNNATCAQNPQFLVKVKQQTEITAVLYQGLVPLVKGSLAPDQIGFYVFKTKEKKLKLEKLATSDFVAKSAFSSTREAVAKFTLHPNSLYALVPSTFDAGRDGPFSLVLFSDAPVKIAELFDRSVLALRGEWKGLAAGGAPPLHTWRNNPQYFLLPSRALSCTVTITQRDALLQPISFFVTRGTPAQAAGHRMLQLRSDDIIGKVGPETKRSLSLELQLERSATPYVVIPCAGGEGEFLVSIEGRDSDATAVREALNVVPCNYQWKQAAMRGKWMSAELPFAQQPQYALKVEKQASAVIVLAPHERDSVARSSLQLFRVAEKAQLRDEKEAEILDRTQSQGPTDEHVVARDLSPGYYTIVASGEAADKQCAFELIVYATDDINLDLAGSRLLPKMLATAPQASAPMAVPGKTSTSIPASGTPGAAGTGAGGGTDIFKWLLELNDVELHEKIGQGAYGAVFRATLKSKEAGSREAAVKKLSFRDEDEAGEQRKEVLLMSRFTHPNIVQFLGACVDGHELHIVTEFCSRGNLSHCLKAGEIDWNTKLRLACDAARGMEYLHGHRPPIVHRDLKSLNLLVDRDWNCKIADFGLSKVTSGQTLNSRMGSLNWVAPEILLQNSAYTEYADIYSFGLILWETLTHQLPYAGLSPLQIVKAKDAGDVPPVPADTNKAFAKLIKDCCESKPRSRPQFGQVLARLELLLLEGVVPLPGKTSGPTPVTSPMKP